MLRLAQRVRFRNRDSNRKFETLFEKVAVKYLQELQLFATLI